MYLYYNIQMIALRILISLLVACAFIGGALVYQATFDSEMTPAPETAQEAEPDTTETNAPWTDATERYSARADRVDVVFEHKDYTHYRLQTNELMRTGDLNTERGFGDDIDATVYVLNWREPEGAQIRYVRLTSEPTHLYILDSNQEIVRGSRLTLDTD